MKAFVERKHAALGVRHLVLLPTICVPFAKIITVGYRGFLGNQNPPFEIRRIPLCL